MQVHKIGMILKKGFYTIALIAFSVVPGATQKLRLQRNEIPKIKVCESMVMLLVHVYKQENLRSANFRTPKSTEKIYYTLQIRTLESWLGIALPILFYL